MAETEQPELVGNIEACRPDLLHVRLLPWLPKRDGRIARADVASRQNAGKDLTHRNGAREDARECKAAIAFIVVIERARTGQPAIPPAANAPVFSRRTIADADR